MSSMEILRSIDLEERVILSIGKRRVDEKTTVLLREH